MIKTKLNNHGFHVLPLLLIVVVVAVIGLVGWRVIGSNQTDDVKSVNDGSGNRSQSEENSTSTEVTWSWGGEQWIAQGGTPPDCGTGPGFKSPVDTTKVKSVLYPGQQRSTGYKAHGGFLVEENDTDVTIPINSHLVKASRYIEMGEVQYYLVFSMPCGYVYKLDHLRTLTPKFQALMDKLPEPKKDDSRTTSIEPAVSVTAGEKVATSVGFKTATAGFDFGIFDVRSQNAISKTGTYAEKHQQEKEFAFYGVCFFDYMGDEGTSLRKLPGADQAAGKTIDYCN